MTGTAVLKKQVKKFVENATEQELRIIYKLFEMGEEDWWKQIDKDHKAAIKEAMKEADEGKVIPHKEMVKKYSKWLRK